MNKNKLVFLAIGVIVCILILLIFVILRSGGTTKVTKSTVDVWTVGHSPTSFLNLLSEFKEENSGSVKVAFTHKNFENFNDYQTALLYELANGDGPDIFMLNNSESLFLDDRISGIDPSYIQPEDFRKNFLSPFSEELIASIPDTENPKKSIDFLIGVPAGFEALGLYYDRRSFIGQDLKTWSGVGEAIKDIKQKSSRSAPLGIGHGTSVYGSHDIFTQFLVNNGSLSITDLDLLASKKSIASYQLYGDESGDNAFNEVVPRLESLGKNNIALFSTGEIKMLVGYPSLLKEIKKSGFSKSYLSAEPFPKSIGTDDKLSINYNYFVINNKSQKIDAASTFLAYLASEEGADDYYEIFTDKIPSHALLADNLDQKFDEDFNISYKDVLRDQIELVSYDKGIRHIYDEKIPAILDNTKKGTDMLLDLQELINCKVQNINSDLPDKPNCEK